MTIFLQLLKSRTVIFAILLAVLSVVQGYVGLAISVIVTILCIVTFGRSLPGETISAAAWSLEGDGKWQWQRHLYKKE